MGIEKVIIKKKNFCHEDGRRILSEIFNNNEFCAKQVKVAEVKGKDTLLGGHYHNYDELFYILKGEGKFTLEDINTKQKEEYLIEESQSIFIPEKVAHKVNIKRNSILIGCTAEPYLNPGHNDKKYDL